MSEINVLDEIEVVDLEEYACSDKPIPKHVKYYLIRVDDEKLRVRSPITANEILIASDLDPCEYRLEQKFKGGRRWSWSRISLSISESPALSIL